MAVSPTRRRENDVGWHIYEVSDATAADSVGRRLLSKSHISRDDIGRQHITDGVTPDAQSTVRETGPKLQSDRRPSTGGPFRRDVSLTTVDLRL